MTVAMMTLAIRMRVFGVVHGHADFREKYSHSQKNVTMIGLSWCFLSRGFPAWNRRRFLAQVLGELMNIHGILVRLFAEFVCGQVIFFAMGDCRGGVRVGSEIMEFCNSFVWYL